MNVARVVSRGFVGVIVVSALVGRVQAASTAAAQDCHLDLLAGYEGQGIRIHSTFQKNSDEFSNAAGVLFFVGDNSEEVPLSDGIGHLANGHTAVLSYRGGKTVVLVIDWQQGVVTSGSINGLPLLPSLSNSVACNAQNVALSNPPSFSPIN